MSGYNDAREAPVTHRISENFHNTRDTLPSKEREHP